MVSQPKSIVKAIYLKLSLNSFNHIFLFVFMKLFTHIISKRKNVNPRGYNGAVARGSQELRWWHEAHGVECTCNI